MKFDLLIRNGLMIDGTGGPAREADVGVAGDRIADVGRFGDAVADVVIESRGMVVAPGFIDIHGHSDYFIMIEPGAPNKLRQGVTSEVGGNCGYSAAPISKELSDERGESLEHNFGIRPDWTTLGQYYERLRRIGPAINFGILVGHNTIRASVMKGDARPPAPGELQAMRRLAREGMADGALGISTGLIYPPGCFADSNELAEVCSEVREGFFATHMRSEGKDLIPAIEEVIEAARKARIRLQISHLKTSGRQNWDKMERAIGLMEEARANGMDVRCDRYPYIASFTGLSATLPSWVFEGSREEYRKRLQECTVRDKIRREILDDHPEEGYLDTVVIAQTFSIETHKIEGLSLSEAARRAGRDAFEFLFDLLASEESDPTAIYHSMKEDNMLRVLKWPHSVIGSDSASRAPSGPLGLGKPHPRAYGCFPRFLTIVREKKLMTLEDAIKKMTSETAKIAGIKARGVLKRGCFADIVVFDPDKIADRATYDNPHQFATGIKCVIVNGKIAVMDDEITGARNGYVLLRDELDPKSEKS